MTVQNIINEVNSIQTKKKAIKDAITSKGVTSEGKLSKFADEINKITTKEPDWYIVNKFRYDNGNEALYVRTSDKNAINANKYQMVEIGGGVTKDNDINTNFSDSYNNELGITNGSYFPRETAYRSFTTREDSNVVFNGHNDNLKLRFRNGKEIVFNDVNVYNWLKGYRNQPLADYNTLYLKSDGFSERNPKNLSDFLAPTNKSTTLTVGTFGATPLLLIDSSIMLQAMNLREISRIGFISYSDKAVDTISLIPASYANNEVYAPFYDNKEQWYGNLSPGNYVHLFKNGKLIIVFVSVNYIIDNNSQKHKNIEVYIYKIIKGNNIEVNYTKIDNKPFELYLTFSNQAQQRLQEAIRTKFFRKQVLKANGTPEPRESNFLTESDALNSFACQKATNANAVNPTPIVTLFLKNQAGETIRYINPPSSSATFYSIPIAKKLAYDIKNGVKTTGFIRLNGDNMLSIELEKATDEVKNFLKTSQFKLELNKYNPSKKKNLLWISHNGFPGLNNRTIIFVASDQNNDIDFYYLKKSNDYITNDLLSTARKTHYLYLTSDTDTQQYLATKSLDNIWTEIQDVLAHKDDFEAYYED